MFAGTCLPYAFHLLTASRSIEVIHSELPTASLLSWPTFTPVSLEKQLFVLGDHAPNEFGAQPFPIFVLGSFMRIGYLDINYFETRHRTSPTENIVFALMSDVLSDKANVPLYAVSLTDLGIAQSVKVRESLLDLQREPNQSPLPLNVTLAAYRAGLLRLGLDSAVSSESDRTTGRVAAVKWEFERTLHLPFWKRTLRDCTRLILDHSTSYLERGLIDFTRPTEVGRISLPKGN